MELTKEAVNRCRCVGALRDFLCQAMDQINEKDKEIAQQKRKRCLALAKWCKLEQERIELIENQDITDDDFDKLVKGFYTKWQKRFLSIADKFKEA